MHWLYKKSSENGGIRFKAARDISLFGSPNGYIPFYLKHQLKPGEDDPCLWRLNMTRCLALSDTPDTVIIVDVKPDDSVTLSLYELLDVWGYSDEAWSPVMFRLQPLLVDEPKNSHNKFDFTLAPDHSFQPLYTLLYLSGGVRKGELTGRWIPPRTRYGGAVLLNSEVFDYFYECKKQ